MEVGGHACGANDVCAECERYRGGVVAVVRVASRHSDVGDGYRFHSCELCLKGLVTKRPGGRGIIRKKVPPIRDFSWTNIEKDSHAMCS